MPEPQTAANVWFYQDFLANGQKEELWTNRPEDWNRLQILEGNTLKPAMEPGFQGRPTSAQVEMLYQHALQGKLFFFELGNPAPRMLGQEGNEKRFVDPNAQEPEAPEKPPEGANSSLMVSYQARLNDYNERMEVYQRNLDDLKALGDDFKNAVDAYNDGRDLQWEGAERNGRHVNQISVRNQRNRAKADRVIDELFGPKPVAAPDVFYVPGHPTGETVFKFEHYGEQFAPNAIELPAGSKLSAQDVATINFAMLGAKTPVMEACQKRLESSPLQTENMATDGFNMLVTGMFGEPRINQQLSDNKLIGDVLQMSKDVIEQYNNGNAELLGKHLGDCVRNVKDVFAGSANNAVTQDMVAATKLIERVQGLLQKDPALMQAANLQDDELEFMRGYVQMGKLYDNYLQSFVTLNDAKAHGQVLSTDKKAELLADVVLRAMMENELTQEREILEASYWYKNLKEQAEKKDQVEQLAYDKWREDVMDKMEDTEAAAQAQAKYLLQHDYNMHTASIYSVPMEHKVISMLAKSGMLEHLRQNLQKDPYVLAAAAKEPMDISGNDLFQSDEMKALAKKASATLHGMEFTGQQKLTWFNNMKTVVSRVQGGQDPNTLSPWLNASVEGDAGRLMIAMPNGRGGKSLVSVASLLEGGMNDLVNPTQQAIDLMYRNALEGNLYYYQVGQELPLRITANRAEAFAEQIKAPVEPTLWQKFANIITAGWAYADICNPKPDRDPAAIDGILYSSDGRRAIITVEIAEHSNQPSAQVNQERKSYEQRINDEVNNFSRIPDDSIRREFPQYELGNVIDKLNAHYRKTFKMEDTVLANVISKSTLFVRDKFSKDSPTEQDIREAMASAVLLEAAKEEHLSGQGDTMCNQLMKNHDGMAKSLASTDAFRAFTEDASMDMLKHFIMTDGARNMLKAMKTIASNRAMQQEPGKEANALEQNVQKQNENQGIGMG